MGTPEKKGDLSKTLGDSYTAFDEFDDLDYIYLYISDAYKVEVPESLPRNVYVISRNDHPHFYGEFRTKLRNLRDTPKSEVPKLLTDARKKIKSDVDSMPILDEISMDRLSSMKQPTLRKLCASEGISLPAHSTV